MRYVGSCRKPVRGPEHPNWRGGRHIRKREGYVELRITDHEGRRAYVLEHRYVMAQHLDRDLGPHETVHHKNGDKADNRLENLELRVGRHGRGATEPHCPTCTCFAH
jgi:O-acetylhomoserine/O-acetylserine sulfhydrylase-like pyridoxal-dependent enzyme